MVMNLKKPMEPRVRTTRPRGFQIGGGVELGSYNWNQATPHSIEQGTIGSSGETGYGNRGQGVFGAGQGAPIRTGTLRQDSSSRERERQQRQHGQSMGWSVRSRPPSFRVTAPTILDDPLREIKERLTRDSLSGLASQEWMAQGGRVYNRNQPGYAVGGLITPNRPGFKQKDDGTGTLIRPPTTDTVSAVLTPGEHVIDNKNADYIRRNPTDLSNLQRVAGDIQRGTPSAPPSLQTPPRGITAEPGSSAVAAPAALRFDSAGGQAPDVQYSWLTDAAQSAADYVARKGRQLGNYVGDAASSASESGFGFGPVDPAETQTPEAYRNALNDPDRWSEDPIPAGVNPATSSWNSTVYGGDLNARADEIARNIFGESDPNEVAAILALLQAGYDVAPDGTVFFARQDDRNLWVFHNIGNLKSNPIYNRVKGEQLKTKEETEQEKSDAAIEAGRQDRLTVAEKGVEAARSRGADIIRRSAELAAKNKARAAGQATRSAFMAMATRPGEAGLAQAADVRQMGILAGANEQLVGELEAEKMLLMAELQKLDVEMGNINERIQFERDDTLRDQHSREQQHLLNQKIAFQSSMADIEAQIALASEPGWWDKWGPLILGTAGSLLGNFLLPGVGGVAGGMAGTALASGTTADPSSGRLIAPSGQTYQGSGGGSGYYDTAGRGPAGWH